MKKPSLLVLIAALAWVVIAIPAQGATLGAVTQGASAIGSGTATLSGQVTPSGASTTYHFEYGTTPAYGASTPVTYVANPPTAQVVNATLNGLSPATLYHYRVVADNGSAIYGLDKTFTTTAAPSGAGTGTGGTSTGTPGPTSTPGPTGTSGTGTGTSGTATGANGSPTSGSGTTGLDPLHGTDPISGGARGAGGGGPVLGRSIGAAPASGSILVQVAGERGFAPLIAGAPLPVGSTVDARRGSVNIVTAIGSHGAFQTATFSAGVFNVRQTASAGGMTDIFLRGGNFRACRSAARNRVRGALGAARGPRTVRRLAARDHHGRFRTHGSGAVATVRGTAWVMADRCDGTLTTVTQGAVSVRDLRLRKTRVVRAGGAYLARYR